MSLDAAALATLEVFESSEGQASRSLFGLLDCTKTPPGARALRECSGEPVDRSPGARGALGCGRRARRRSADREALRQALAEVGDVERRFARIAVGTAGPREVAAWAEGLAALPAVAAAAAGLSGARLRSLADGIPDASDLVRRVREALVAEPPVLASAGGVLRDEADPELAELRRLRHGAQGALLEIEAAERKRSGISNLRVRYNRVFGYSLEVGAAHREKVPSDWIRRQSLANAERFVTPALKELEEKILTAEDRIGEIEARLYRELLEELSLSADRVGQAAARGGGARPVRRARGDRSRRARGSARSSPPHPASRSGTDAIRSSRASGGRSRLRPTTATSRRKNGFSS